MAKYIDVHVTAADESGDDVELRFHALGEPKPVTRVRYARTAAHTEEVSVSSGGKPAMAAQVDDSSAGTSTLVFGGESGLTLTTKDGRVYKEPYLLLEEADVLE